MLATYFQQFQLFSEEEISFIVSKFIPRTIEKNEYFIKQGESCREIAFVKSGIVRSYYNNQEGQEKIYCFRFPNDFMASYSAYITDSPSLETFQAITDTEVLVVQKSEMDKFVVNDRKWNSYFRYIAEEQYIELERRVHHLLQASSKERYQYLLDNQPSYIQDIPLHYLASYLGITQRHLSRIRKEIAI